MKVLIQVDKRLDPSSRPNELLFFNPRARLDPDAALSDDVDDTAAIIGTNMGWKEIKNTVKYRNGPPHYTDGLMLYSPNVSGALVNYQPQLNSVSVDSVAVKLSIDDVAKVVADLVGVAMPVLSASDPVRAGYLWDSASDLMRSAG